MTSLIWPGRLSSSPARMQVCCKIIFSVKCRYWWSVLYRQIGIGKETAKVSPRRCQRALDSDNVKYTGITHPQCESIHRRSQWRKGEICHHRAKRANREGSNFSQVGFGRLEVSQIFCGRVYKVLCLVKYILFGTWKYSSKETELHVLFNNASVDF